ncbi:hypothetical protein ACH9DO_05735 [Kocuria sp. M1N1S27]|uniref:hypothetical protein n=1 Tax=Kocuria kalidii TaxID=3376283 RepID=UPI003788114C
MGNYDLTWPALTLVVGGVAWFVGTGFRRGAFLSPYSLILLILLSVFGFRPLLMPAEPVSFDFYGHDISNGYRLATIIGFVGTLSFIAGYATRRLMAREGSPELDRPLLPRVTPGRAALAAWALLALWLGVMIVAGGGPGFLAVLFAGRSDAANTVFAGLPAIVPALPVVSCLMAATVRFKTERIRRYRPHENMAYWIIAVVAIIPPSALGTRRFIIPSVLIMIVGALARSWDRKVRPTWLIAGIAGFLILAIVPFVRSAGSRVGGRTDLLGAMSVYFRDEGARGTLDNFFLSYDTEMFNWVAYFAPRLGETIPYGMGRGTAGEVLSMSIPAAVSPFERWNDTLLTYAFGAGCGAGTVCPVPSIVGVLHSDLSWVGLTFGMAILGVLCANYEGRLMASRGSYTALLLLATGFSILFARGNSMAQVWIAVQVFVAWWIVYIIVSTLAAPRAQGGSTALPRSVPVNTSVSRPLSRHAGSSGNDGQ